MTVPEFFEIMYMVILLIGIALGFMLGYFFKH